MAYSSITKPSLHFNDTLYTGDGTNSRSVTGVGFQPDLLWLKSRSGATAYHPQLHDAVRGATQGPIYSSLNSAEDTSYGISSFDSDGFTLRNPSHDSQNGNTYTFASWNFKANGSGSANTDGSISSTVSANTTSGFSIVKNTGTGSAGTIGHGLGAAPKMILTKNLADAANWGVYHFDMHSTDPADYYMHLNTTGARVDNANFWNDTEPTSSVFSVGSANNTNDSGDAMIHYCFAEKQGYSNFGLYVGNGNSNGPFVYTGFKPAFILLKAFDTADRQWVVLDNKRIGYNDRNYRLFANLSNVEDTTTGIVDFLSNGFRFTSSNNNSNQNGVQYLYMALAENPLVANVSGGLPATAR